MSRTASTNDGYLYAFKGCENVYEMGIIPLFDEMVKRVDRLVLLQVFRICPFPTAKSTGEFLCKGLVFTEFPENGFVG